MARANRGNVPAGIYHVTRRSAGSIDMFRDDFDRTDFCRRLERAIKRFTWTCHAFVLMDTHYHLLLAVPSNTLQPGMHALNGPYAQAFNRRWGRTGHLRGSPYTLKPILDDGHLLSAVRYIARNPVRARLCAAAADWIWGSYRGCVVAAERRFGFVTDVLTLACLSDDRETARRFLRLIVETP